MVRRNWIWWLALAAAVAFDFLFWGHAPGISFFVFVAVCLAAGIASAAASGAAPNGKSAVLIPCILASAAVTFWRTEPLTVFCGAALSLGLMMILAYTYRGGKWLLYGIADHIAAAFRLLATAALHPALLPPQKENAAESSGKPPVWRRWLPPLLRGLVLALPIVLVFAALLSAADPVFERALQYVFDIQRLPEYVFRLSYVLIGMYLLAGVFLYAVISSREEQLPPPDSPRVKPFIGFIESAVVLGSVGMLFAVFVAIQFRYFFGGVENITAEGFTYAEYARRGFGELVAVACLCLVLLMGFGSLTRREGSAEGRIFSALGVILVAMVVVMLVSSYRRLTLYEDAYGFTRLRMYTHVFILWLGALLVAVTAIELAGRLRYFSAAAIATALGFALTLAVVNVDATIVRSNGLRSDVLADGGGGRSIGLDTVYFSELSADAVPELLKLYEGASPPERDRIGADLSCRLTVMEQNPRDAWQSYLWPVAEALRLLRGSGVAEQYPVAEDREWLVVSVNGEYERCAGGEPVWME